MLMARYCWLLLLFHFSLFFRMTPWTFLWGLFAQWPWYSTKLMLVDGEHKRVCVANGSRWHLESEGTGETPLMPPFVRKRFENIYQEATSP